MGCETVDTPSNALYHTRTSPGEVERTSNMVQSPCEHRSRHQQSKQTPVSPTPFCSLQNNNISNRAHRSTQQKRNLHNKRSHHLPFPIAFLGIESNTLISCGILYAANRSFNARRISIGPQALPFRPVACASGFSTTTATTLLPHCSEGRPTTAASAICGLAGVGSQYIGPGVKIEGMAHTETAVRAQLPTR